MAFSTQSRQPWRVIAGALIHAACVSVNGHRTFATRTIALEETIAPWTITPGQFPPDIRPPDINPPDIRPRTIHGDICPEDNRPRTFARLDKRPGQSPTGHHVRMLAEYPAVQMPSSTKPGAMSGSGERVGACQDQESE